MTDPEFKTLTIFFTVRKGVTYTELIDNLRKVFFHEVARGGPLDNSDLVAAIIEGTEPPQVLEGPLLNRLRI